jgi:superfamily II DNA or RNA helicase
MPANAKTTTPQRQRGREPLLSSEECKAIAAEYDGTTAALDRLLVAYRRRHPGLERHNVVQAARRGGYATRRTRKGWSPVDDQFLREQWHKMSGDEVAAALGRSFNSVNLRRKRLGIGRYDGDELTIRDLEEATGLDHRQWHEFIWRGWLQARQCQRRAGAPPITYVAVPAVAKLLRSHPEVYEYRAAPKYTRVLLELDRLPDPPKFKRVTCLSRSWQDQVKPTPTGRKVNHGAAALTPLAHRFSLPSCADLGGTGFWAALYEAPQCPRCGCQVSRYSPDAIYSDVDPGDAEILDIQARKLGLRWHDGALRDANGVQVDDSEVLFYVLGASRQPSRAARVVHKLIDAGMKAHEPSPVMPDELLDHILDIELRADQEEAFRQFLAAGCATAAHSMSFGKSTIAMVIMTRLAGRHVVFVDSRLLQEQWVEKLNLHAPAVTVRRCWKPSKVEVTVFDRSGQPRCVIDVFTYMTRARLTDEYVVACYDEEHRLFANLAHRHGLLRSRYRIGMSATHNLRADGRNLCDKITGPVIGDDWAPQMESGVLRKLPVRVLICQDVEHKHEVVGDFLRKFATVVLCEALEDGRALESRYGIPFICSDTKNKLAVIRAARSVCLSRVGDGGLSIRHCEVTIDHSGLFGSRVQSLQRLGRLLHSEAGRFHVILMTPAERERFAKRVDVLRDKGFAVTEEVAPRDTAELHRLPPTVRGLVTANENPLLAALGWRRRDLPEVA